MPANSKKIQVEYHTVSGGYSKFNYDIGELMENILPDMRPLITTIIINSTYEGRAVQINISSSGVVVFDAKT